MSLSADQSHTHVFASKSTPVMEKEDPHGPTCITLDASHSKIVDLSTVTSQILELGEGMPLNSSNSDTGNHATVNDVETKMPSILPSAWLDLEAGPELISGPVNNPERTSSPLPVYGPMNNASADDFITERVSKDLKGLLCIFMQCTCILVLHCRRYL